MEQGLDIVVVSYQRADLLKRLVQSIINCTTLPYSLFIVDNKSPDSQVKAYLNCESNFIGIDYKIKFCDDNYGYSKATNIGASLGSRKNILVLNNDIEVTKDYDTIANNFMHKHSACGVIGYRLVDRRDICRGCGVTDEWRLRGFNLPIDKAIIAYNKPSIVKYVGGSALFTRRSVWEHLNGFDERWRFYFEDADYCLRVRELGFKSYYLPHTIIHDYEGSLNTSSDASRAARNKYFTEGMKLWAERWPHEQGYS